MLQPLIGIKTGDEEQREDYQSCSIHPKNKWAARSVNRVKIWERRNYNK